MNRILVLTPEFPPQPGGIGSHAWNLAKELQTNGNEVLVVTNSRMEQKKESDFDNEQAFKIKRICREKFSFMTFLQRVLIVKQQVKLFNPGIILFSGKFSIWMLAILKLNTSIKKTAIVHGSELTISNFFQRSLLLKGLSRSTNIIAVSNFTKSLIPKIFYSKTKVIFNGFNTEMFKGNVNEIESLESLQLITVGAMSQRKGQQNVIEALPLLKNKFTNIKYHIVGIPTNKRFLGQLAETLGVRSQVVFHGVLTQNELNALLLQSTIFMMLSEATELGEVEGFGIALLEANYLGIPTIGSKGCGIEDAINHQNSGILVDAHNPVEIENAIEEIVDNYKFYKQNAMEWSKLFTWKKVIKSYTKVLDL